MNYMTAVHSDVGIKKKTNQDSVLLEIASTDFGPVLMGVICDGMGGLDKGEVASAMLIREMSGWFHRIFPDLLYTDLDPNILRESWTTLIWDVNKKITEYGLDHGVDLGTTITLLLLIDNIYYIINVGDSRVYLIKNQMMQLTVDQTFVQREMDLGRMTPEEAKKSNKRNVLLQCVGASSIIEPDFYVGEYSKDSVFMICSDGFRHKIKPEEFYLRLNPYDMLTEEVMSNNALYFTELNKSRRENDNISVVLIRAY